MSETPCIGELSSNYPKIVPKLPKYWCPIKIFALLNIVAPGAQLDPPSSVAQGVWLVFCAIILGLGGTCCPV